MAGSVNKVIIVGNLGRDPESKAFQNGGKVVNLRIATSESWKDKMSGERKEKTEWHSVAIFNEGLANVAEKFLRKGSKVYIEGALQTRKWQDAQGQDKYSTEIVLQGFNSVLTMLDGPGGGRPPIESASRRRFSPESLVLRASQLPGLPDSPPRVPIPVVPKLGFSPRISRVLSMASSIWGCDGR